MRKKFRIRIFFVFTVARSCTRLRRADMAGPSPPGPRPPPPGPPLPPHPPPFPHPPAPPPPPAQYAMGKEWSFLSFEVILVAATVLLLMRVRGRDCCLGARALVSSRPLYALLRARPRSTWRTSRCSCP